MWILGRDDFDPVVSFAFRRGNQRELGVNVFGLSIKRLSYQFQGLGTHVSGFRVDREKS